MWNLKQNSTDIQEGWVGHHMHLLLPETIVTTAVKNNNILNALLQTKLGSSSNI